MSQLSAEAIALIEGRHADPFVYLGPHLDDGVPIVRAYLPDARQVSVLESGGEEHPLARIHPAGLFAGRVEAVDRPYRLRALFGEHPVEFEDAYRFPPILSDFDLHLLGEGKHLRAYERLGARPLVLDGVKGVAFAVLAPDAKRVSVVGDFNFWDGRRHAMRVRGNGFWEIFVPDARAGDKYKYEIMGAHGQMLPLKADPVAFAAEMRPNTASIIVAQGALPLPAPAPPGINARSAPISIYEVHLGSWRRRSQHGGSWLSYRELAEELPAYVRDLGFSHVEFLPITEHPFDGSWGYQPTGMFAPTSRFGTPADFAALIDACHRAELGVILDWVPGHFPDDPHGLRHFDGRALYEHLDPKQGRHLDWNTLIYNFGRTEVANFLLASGLFWLDRYHVDGLRVDAVASMLYLDYSRPEGGWIPNVHGGREDLDSIAFLRELNELVHAREPGVISAAEESTSWPGVSRPTYLGGLGFGFKWNMGWMHDTLGYFANDPVYRRYHHNELMFSMIYAFTENFVLPLSHDEVVHGKRSLLGKMPGDRWQKFANLRLLYAYMWAHPGKKLLFMGGELAEWEEWNYDGSLHWNLLEYPEHQGVQSLVRDLNHAYRANPALYEVDFESSGFHWLEPNDAAGNVLAFARLDAKGERAVVCVLNLSPVPRYDYRVGMPASGRWQELVNTDSAYYGGSGVGNLGGVDAQTMPWHDQPFSALLTLPP